MLPTTLWELPSEDEQVQRELEEELGINSIISQILINRNIRTPSEARKFLYPSLKDLHNPFLMKDIDKGTDRLIRALSKGERISVYGDYDADGITSVAVLVKFLSNIHDNITYYIPDKVGSSHVVL